MEEGWKEDSLKTIAISITNGFNPKKESNQKYLGLEHVEQESLRINSIGNSNETTSNKKKFFKGDILFGRLRPYFRKVVQPKFNGVCSSEFIVINAKEGNSQKYLYYLIADKDFVDRITKTCGGVDRPRAQWNIISELKIVYPKSYFEQQKIATILSNYDDLIENNLKRIELLEKTAKLIYEEWFVKFKFPGHEDVKMVESEIGIIPEGWDAVTLRSLIDYYIGGGWGKETIDEDHIVEGFVIRGTDFPKLNAGNLKEVPFRFHKKNNFNSRKLRDLDIIFEVSGGSKDQPVGRNYLVSEPILKKLNDQVMFASFCKLIRIKNKKLAHYIHMFLNEAYTNGIIEQYQVQSTGISNFKFEAFIDNVEIAIPNENLIEAQDVFFNYVYSQIFNLRIKINNLQKTRDLLLPKLINGVVNVSNLDIVIPEAKI